MTRVGRLICGVLVLAGLVQLCAATRTAGQEVPQRGGTMVMGMTSDPPTVNPAITAGAPDRLIGCMVYEGLVRFAKGFRIEPALAKSWAISPDGLRYTFHLVAANWQDGTPFTSRDVAFSLQNINGRYGPLFTASRRAISAIDTPNPSTVVITLEHPFGPLLLSLSCDQNGGILPAHLFADTDILRNPATLARPVGTGPFRLTEWVHSDHMTLQRNPDYWRSGRPYLDEIVIKFLPNAASRVLALQAGEIDYIDEYSLPGSFYPTISANKELQTGEPGYYADFVIILNTHLPPLDKPEVRQALMDAMDRDYLTKAVFSGLGSAAAGPIDSRIAWAYDPAVDYRKMYPYDPDRARGLLDAAGVRPGPDGIRFSIDLVFDSSRQEYGPLSVALQKFWGAIGVKVNLRGSERAVVLKQVYGDYDFGATIQNYGTSGDPALGIARLYVTDSIQQGATFNNVSRYSNPEVDRLFEEGQNSTAQEQRAVYYHQVQAILARDLPTLNINQMGEYDAATRHLHNLFLSQDEPFWDEVWIEH
jgi:peptide/nickel transport system substrate-binding protein